MEEAAKGAADALGVPADQRAAFLEFYATLCESRGGTPAKETLAAWDSPKYLRRSRAEATVRSMLAERDSELNEAVTRVAQALGKDAERLRRQAEQRFIFMSVYAASSPLEDLFRKLLQEVDALPTANVDKVTLKLAPGVFDARHAALRASAYPYTPACGSYLGDQVLNCTFQGGAEPRLVGFMAMYGSYADDVSVDPSCQGRGVAKALVCGMAARLQKQGEGVLSLDVRACNLPAMGLYKSLGFEVTSRRFPGFYDWHGGYHMEAATATVAAQLSADIDISALHSE